MNKVMIKCNARVAPGKYKDVFTRSYDVDNAKEKKALIEELFEMMFEELHSGASFQLRQAGDAATPGGRLAALLAASGSQSTDDEPEPEERPRRRSRRA